MEIIMGYLIIWLIFFGLAPVIALKIGFRKPKNKGGKK